MGIINEPDMRFESKNESMESKNQFNPMLDASDSNMFVKLYSRQEKAGLPVGTQHPWEPLPDRKDLSREEQLHTQYEDSWRDPRHQGERPDE